VKCVTVTTQSYHARGRIEIGIRIPKNGLGVQAAKASTVILVTVFLAEVVPLHVLPESLGHLGWGDLLSFLPTEYGGEMFV
jgi:hypothetical protein